ncbi:hypothetical protein HY636_02980 [Candidatus Woesearchaeota archaeon]|nr:hypothetical protein [Candidatus Woesearchaeota archaeon]
MEKRYETYLWYGLLIVVVLGLVFSIFGFPSIFKGDKLTSNKGITTIDLDKDTSSASTGSGFQTINTGTTGNGDVSIELTPFNVADGKLKVTIAANTHSVDLNPFDLKKITTLEYNGKSIAPSSAPLLQGHHSNGEFVFDVSEPLKSFSIKIRGIPQLEERVYSWG